MPPPRATVHALAALALFLPSSAAPPLLGPFNTTSAIFSDAIFDSSDARVWAWWPTGGGAGATFPLVPYLHGGLGGGAALGAYAALFSQLASWGLVVVAPFSCSAGCLDAANSSRWTQCGGSYVSPTGMGWDAFYGEAFKVIDWARNASAAAPAAAPPFSLIDHAAGYGVAGHSLGGQAAAVAATRDCPARWGVKTAVLHHPASGAVPSGNLGANVSVPLAAFTSDGDAGWAGARAYMAAFASRADGLASAYRDEVGWSHLEPVLWPPCENPLLATYSAAWIRTIVGGDRAAAYALLFRRGRGLPLRARADGRVRDGAAKVKFESLFYCSPLTAARPPPSRPARGARRGGRGRPARQPSRLRARPRGCQSGGNCRRASARAARPAAQWAAAAAAAAAGEEGARFR